MDYISLNYSGAVAIYELKTFARFARGEKIADENLSDAVERARRGLEDADLGGGLINQRVARKGAGRGGGYRARIAVRAGEFGVFLFGFAKNAPTGPDIRSLRERAKLSQAVFARRLNLSVGHVSKLERGAKRPTGPALVLLNIIRRKGIEAIL
jgi:hypothetical protein